METISVPDNLAFYAHRHLTIFFCFATKADILYFANSGYHLPQLLDERIAQLYGVVSLDVRFAELMTVVLCLEYTGRHRGLRRAMRLVEEVDKVTSIALADEPELPVLARLHELQCDDVRFSVAIVERPIVDDLHFVGDKDFLYALELGWSYLVKEVDDKTLGLGDALFLSHPDPIALL